MLLSKVFDYLKHSWVKYEKNICFEKVECEACQLNEITHSEIVEKDVMILTMNMSVSVYQHGFYCSSAYLHNQRGVLTG